jgi:hypothetical protein
MRRDDVQVLTACTLVSEIVGQLSFAGLRSVEFMGAEGRSRNPGTRCFVM